jgi:hypothetical protein
MKSGSLISVFWESAKVLLAAFIAAAVIEIMRLLGWYPENVVTWIAFITIFGAIIFIEHLDTERLRVQLGRCRSATKMNLYLLVAMVAFLVFSGAIVGYLIDIRRSEIEWGVDGSPFGLEIEAQMERVGAPVTVHIYGFAFNGRNVSRHTLYQIDASVTVEHTKEVLQMYVVAEGQWVLAKDINGIAPGVRFTVGCQMRADTVHCGSMTKEMTPEQFMIDVGAFKFTFRYDGKEYTRSFSASEIAQQIEDYRHRIEEEWRKNPMMQPSVTKRK